VATVAAAGRAGIPAHAAVVLNVTAVNPSGPGYLSVYQCGTASTGSNVNYGSGETVADLAVTPLAANGTVCVRTFAAADVVVDAMGWFAPGAPFVAVSPRRIVDTRSGLGAATGPVAGGTSLRVNLAAAGVPAGARAAAITVTLTQPVGDGYATVYPCDSAPPLASDLDYLAGGSVPAFTLATPRAGAVCVFTSATAHVLVDLAGWLGASSGFHGVTPVRLVDTRDAENAPSFR
jgi:hypothetical protein